MKKHVFTTLLVGVALVTCTQKPAANAKNDSNKDDAIQNNIAQVGYDAKEEKAESVNAGADYEVRIKSNGDSARIEGLLKEGAKLKAGENITMFYARKFLGLPYVGGTLDVDKEEGLIINTRQLDCTTFVENVLALTVCTKRGLTSFGDFCNVLVNIRYIGGEVAYTKRQHYFTTWIDDNIRDGFIQNIQWPDAPLTAKRTPKVNYMTTHVEAYKMLNAHREWLPAIKDMENSVNKMQFTYIPKAQLANSDKYKKYISDGDIIGIVTNKQGLDISHVGFAVWHNDGLHLFHASSLRKKVVDDSITMFQYLQRQKSSVGIRVVKVL